MILRKLDTFRRLYPTFGLTAMVKWGYYRRYPPQHSGRYKIHPRCVLHALNLRGKSSDLDVFKQIFVFNEYDCILDIPDGGLIVDCGANVGYSSAYLLSHFPKSKFIAVEPDSANFAMLQLNMAPYGDRIKTIQAGIWSHSAGLVISEEKYRDGREWAHTVRPIKPGETPQFQGVDIGSLLANSGFDRISLLKIDIEGAEAVIFKENYKGWLDKVDNIAIELHKDSIFGDGIKVFHEAIEGQGFEISKSHELTICRRRA